MYSIRSFVFVFLLIFILTPVSASSAAEPAFVAVVDVQKLLSESKAAKDMHSKVKKHQEKFVEGLRKQEEKLRKQEKDLIDKRSSLSQDEFTKRRKEFEEELIKTRREAQTSKRDLDKAAGKALNSIRAEIYKVVEAIADEEGYNLIVSRQNVILGANSIDITKETLKRLDKSIKSVTLKIKSN